MRASAPVRGGFVRGEAQPTSEGEQAAGAILNYSADGLRSGDVASLSALGELRVFGAGPGTWSTSLNGRVATGPHASSDITRLDSAWRLDMPGSTLSLTIGDTFTGATSCSRPLRICWIRLARHFAFHPYRITPPIYRQLTRLNSLP